MTHTPHHRHPGHRASATGSRLLLLLLLLLLFFLPSGMSAGDGVRLLSRPVQDSILLRWAPTSRET